jgi:ABC-type nickel/cobalt efflux system permease component RcnA
MKIIATILICIIMILYSLLVIINFDSTHWIAEISALVMVDGLGIFGIISFYKD